MPYNSIKLTIIILMELKAKELEILQYLEHLKTKQQQYYQMFKHSLLMELKSILNLIISIKKNREDLDKFLHSN
jgi:hypothetical protein